MVRISSFLLTALFCLLATGQLADARRVHHGGAEAYDYCSRASLPAGTGRKQVDNLARVLVGKSVWDNIAVWLMSAGLNAGSGTTVHVLGGGTPNDMVLVNGPTWGADGVTLTVGQYVSELGGAQPDPLTGQWNYGTQFAAGWHGTPVASPADNTAFLSDFASSGDDRSWLLRFIGADAGDPYSLVTNNPGHGGGNVHLVGPATTWGAATHFTVAITDTSANVRKDGVDVTAGMTGSIAVPVNQSNGPIYADAVATHRAMWLYDGTLSAAEIAAIEDAIEEATQ